MNTCIEQIFKDCLENRKDDYSRRVYADYLIDYGMYIDKIYGEFIHLQLNIDSTDPMFSISKDTLKTLIQSPIKEHRECAILYEKILNTYFLPTKTTNFVLRRGFPISVSCIEEDFIKQIYIYCFKYKIYDIKLKDKEPFHMQGRSDMSFAEYVWYNSRVIAYLLQGPYIIDEKLFKLLPAAREETNVGKPYFSEKEALYALNLSCVKYMMKEGINEQDTKLLVANDKRSRKVI